MRPTIVIRRVFRRRGSRQDDVRASHQVMNTVFRGWIRDPKYIERVVRWSDAGVLTKRPDAPL